MIPLELIRNLSASNADQDIEFLCGAVRVLGVKHGLSLEAMQDIAEVASELRTRAVNATVESARIALAEVLRSQP